MFNWQHKRCKKQNKDNKLQLGLMRVDGGVTFNLFAYYKQCFHDMDYS